MELTLHFTAIEYGPQLPRERREAHMQIQSDQINSVIALYD